MPLKEANDAENVVVVVKNEDVHENDVLMGRGGKNNKHVGNERLRDVARGYVERYQVSTKKVKSAISREIVKVVRRKDPPGRFLKRVAETGDWEDVGDYLAREKVAQVLRDAVGEAAEASKAEQVIEMQSHSTQFDQRRIEEQARSPRTPHGEGVPIMVGPPPGYRMPYPWYPYNFPGLPPSPHSPFPPAYHPKHPNTPGAYPHPARPPHLLGLPTGPLTPYMQAPRGPPSPMDADPSACPSCSTPIPVTQEHSPDNRRKEAVMAWDHKAYATPANKKGRPKRSRSLPVEGEIEDKPSPTKKKSIVKASSALNISQSQTPTLAAVKVISSDAGYPPPPAAAAATLHPAAPVSAVASMESQHPPGSTVFLEPHGLRYGGHDLSLGPPQPVLRSYSAPLPEIDPSRGFLSDSDSCHSMDRAWPGRKSTESAGTIEPLPVLPGQLQQRHPAQLGQRSRKTQGRSDRQSVTRTPTGETTEEGFEWFQGQLLLESDEESEDEIHQTPFPI